ncbi:NADPH2:quinone reductase [Parvibaculum indicum]|uniref:NADPH:quinone oxidoreductase family protein n=1 Tax=Parvibaculum indicum TaxID=562969 RepID=UPI00141D88C2|nr:NADPH:quinone oxidoreductase family protein [Parvibaculum indicum]NIJ41248.1 NADPH2:quinone reductase [Parvibaculum indicum]
MKAVLCKEYGPPETLVIEDVPSPEPGKGQVVLEVHAAAVNFPDVLIIENKYQFKPPLPFSPGGEVAGKVVKVGEGVTRVKEGDRVIGSCGWGGFAEEIAIDEGRVTPIPEEMDYTTASAFLMTYGTSHHALKDRAQIKPGETLLVLGAAGGVGLAAVELGKAMGAKVIAAASSEDKLAVCKEHGADETLLYPSGALDKEAQKKLSDQIKELTGGNGADVVYDPVGGDYSEAALRATNWEGRFLVVGFASGPIPKIPLNLALLKGCQIVGVFWGAFTAREPQRNQENLQELMDWFKAGKLKPHVSKTYKFEEVADALNDMAARKVKGKIVLVPSR